MGYDKKGYWNGKGKPAPNSLTYGRHIGVANGSNQYIYLQCCKCSRLRWTAYLVQKKKPLAKTKLCHDCNLVSSAANLKGKKFGFLTVVRKTTERKNHCIVWLCKCKCGNITRVTTNSLHRRSTRSCGCLRARASSKWNAKNHSLRLVGKKFGLLTVIGKTRKRYNYNIVWKCICTCDRIVFAPSYKLTSGMIKDCGCAELKRRKGNLSERVYNRLFHSYKLNAKYRGHSFSISYELLKKLVSSKCYYCGVLPRQQMRVRYAKPPYEDVLYYNGLDRKNNEKGYTKANSVPCCAVCNVMKHSLSPRKFFSHMERILKYRRAA